MANHTTSGAAAAAARQRAQAEARERAAQKAREAAAAEAAAAQAARASQQARPKAAKFTKDELSTGKGGALRRAAVRQLGARGLDARAVAGPPAPLAPAAPQLTRTTADAARLSAARDPAERAKALEALVRQNPDPAYRQALLVAAKPALEGLAAQLVDRKSGPSASSRQAAVDALARTTELLDPASQQQLARTLAQAMPNKVIGDDADQLGGMLGKSVRSGAGASLGVRLASALQESGKSVAADDTSKFVAGAIAQLTRDFEESKGDLDGLHLRLAQELPSWQLTGKDQTTALSAFNANNHLDEATQKVEAQGALLASVLPGAALAEHDEVLKAGAAVMQGAGRGGVVPRHRNQGALLEAAGGAIAQVSALASTKAGAAALNAAVARSGAGERTFLDQAQDDLAKAKDGAKGLIKLRSAVLQAAGTQLLSAAGSGDFEAQKSALLLGLQKNARLFGTSEAKLRELTDTLGKFKPGMSDEALKAATQEAGAKIAKLGERNGALAQSFKGLTVIFGAVAAVKDWTQFSQADVQQKIATISQTLQVGQQGADLVTSTLARFASTAGSDAATAATAGLTAAKLLGAGVGALGAVVSGWQAFDAFSEGKVQEGIGDSLTAIGGAVATAGLFLNGTIAGAPAGVVLNIAGGVMAAAGVAISVFAPGDDPFKAQQDDLGKVLEQLGVKKEVADQLKDFDGDGHNFGAWTSAVAKRLNTTTGELLRSMNGWSPREVTAFLDAARLQRGTDGNNDNRRENAGAVLGRETASALQDPRRAYGRGAPINANGRYEEQRAAQERLRAQVDEATGALTYRDALVERAAAWIRAGRPEA